MKRIISKKTLENIGTAVLALLLAIVVWISATYANDRPRVDYFTQAVPIEITGLPAGMTVVSNVEKTARVRIRAFETSWSTLTAGSFKAVADLTNAQAGVNTIPIKVTCSDRMVSVLESQPQNIYIELEPLTTLTLPVESRLANLEDLPLGYTASISYANPVSATISGPASLVTNVASIQAVVSLLNQRESIEKAVDLRPVDRMGQVVSGVQVNPQSVTVAVRIERRLNYREVAVRALTTGHPANGYYITGVTVEPGTVTVVGPPAVVAEMSGLVSTREVIDITGATKTIVERMSLDLPEGVTVYSEDAQQRQDVFVSIDIAPVMGGSSMEVPLETRKLGEGLAAQLSVPAVDVIITGPAVVLDTLTADLLDAYIDLGGLGIGKHQVKVIVSVQVSQSPALNDLTVTSISPESVEVEITRKPEPTPSAPGSTPAASGNP